MKKERNTILFALVTQFVLLCPAKSMAQNSAPVANAGSSRYAAQDPIVLDGTGSFVPDSYGTLSYTWQQISGPPVVITDANTATPTVGGFTQTDVIQECKFELVVSEGEFESLPDTVEIIIVPSLSEIRMVLENESFDPIKPTIIYFGGGDGANGLPQYAQPPWDSAVLSTKANLLSFPDGYRIDGGTGGSPTYNRLGDAIISYLSARAPIYADPIHIDTEIVAPTIQMIENVTIGKTYSFIQRAIDDAVNGDEIVVSEGTFLESIDFKGKNLMVRSTDPNDSAVVAATIITGDGNNSLVTFSNSEDASCVLAGFTITDANDGIYCSGASPTIVNCSITANVSAGIKLYMGSNPTISNCVIAGNGGSGVTMLKFTAGRTVLVNAPTLVNCTIVGNSETGISEGTPTVLDSIIYGNGVQIAGSSAAVKYSNVQSGFSGEGNIDADPLFADPDNGDYHLKSQADRLDPDTQTWLADDVTSPCIDAGDPSIPISFEPLPNGGIINIGAHGGTVEASKSPAK